MCICTCVVGSVQLKECDCRLQDVEAASGRISTASLNSHVQIKCQICISVLFFQARYTAARGKRMGGGVEEIQQGVQALVSAGSQEHTMESAQQAGGGAGDKMCAGQWWAAGDMCREEQPVLFTGAFQSNLPRRAWGQTSLSIYASFYIWGN